MYASHFGLTEAPFSITPDPHYLYLSEQHREGLAHLLFGIKQPGGFVLLTGEVGTGKTVLCRCLLQQLPGEVDAALIVNPRLTAMELLATMCDELQVEYPAGTRSIKDLVDALYRRLLDAHSRGRRTLVIIDEAQDLSAGVLEQVRLLTNLETAEQKLLHVILIGQPELLRLLERPQIRQLAQRITAHYHLRPFARRDTWAYIRHRVRVAGGKDALFSSAALYRIHRLSRGVPRLINVLCDRALLAAYGNEARRVRLATVRQGASELRGIIRCWRPRRLAWGRAAGILAAALVAGGILASLARIPSWREAEAPTPLPALAQSGPAAPESRATASTDGRTHPAEPARLAALLADSSLPWDEHAAFGGLFSRWGVEYRRPSSGTACDAASRQGLECLRLPGNWSRLRRFDLPAVLDLLAADGKRRPVALVALGREEATLDLGGQEYTFPLGEIEPLWAGSFALLWRPPGIEGRLIRPGMRGRDVVWLRGKLDELLGAEPAKALGDVYDEVLRQRVLDFQRSRSLIADGVVGEETLVRLSRAAGEGGAPSLVREVH